MTDKEKAKAYDEALERAREELEQDLHESGVRAIQRIFPELRESEDERIRKALIDGVRQIRCKNGITQEQMIAYLEKQKEQKPVVTHGETYHVDTLGTQQVIAGKMSQKPTDIDEYKIIKKHITEDSLSSEVNKRLTECGWYVTDDKPAEWSEGDEEMLNSCISSIEESKENRYAYKETDGDTSYDREIAFMKSLPERFVLQPMQEWSDEDEDKIEYIVGSLESLKKYVRENVGMSEEYKEQIFRRLEQEQSWLKALHPQYHGDVTMTEAYKMGFKAGKESSWKPSEEQMMALHYASYGGELSPDELLLLDSLYNQLSELI